MDEGFTMRAAELGDVPEITLVRQALSEAEIGQPFTNESETRTQLTSPDLDLVTDWVVIITPTGELVGSGTVWPEAPFIEIYIDNYVHPDWTGHGIGSALLDWAEERAGQVSRLAPQGERVVIRHGVWLGAHSTEHFFEERGYRAVRFFQALEAMFAEPPSEPVWPDGISVRTMVLGTDDRALYDVKTAAFEDSWEGGEGSFEGWLHQLTEEDGFDPGLVFLASNGDQVVGEAICRADTPDNPDGGYLADLGVRREWRQRGIATALLHHAFGELYRRGHHRITTGVDAESLTGANRLYERVGMTPTFGHSILEKQLIPTVGSGSVTSLASKTGGVLTIRPFEPRDVEAVIELHHLGLTQTGVDAGPGPWDNDLASADAISATYANAGGEFAVGLIQGRMVAMGAIKPQDAGRAEIKRMRVHPDSQGRGYGQAILDHLEASAVKRGVRVLCLDTTTLQDAAIRLYSRNGYVESGRATQGDFRVITFEKRLRGDIGTLV